MVAGPWFGQAESNEASTPLESFFLYWKIIKEPSRIPIIFLIWYVIRTDQLV
jgi:hypothetical protein